MPLYQEDLAYVQAVAFGGFAQGASVAILERLRSAPLAIHTVLDIGCGAGITTQALVAAGFDTVAIEPSPSLLAIARTVAPQATFHLGSAFTTEFPSCDAILAVGEPLTYHAPDADADSLLQHFFHKAARALPPGGLLVFDVIDADGPSLDARGWESAQDWTLLHDTREDRAASRLTRTIETFRKHGAGYRRAQEVHHVKLFAEAAVRAWLQAAQFTVETARSYGGHALLPRRVAFFASRR